MIADLKRAAGARMRHFVHIDLFLLAAALSVSLLGLATMHSFSAENAYFDRQIIWICIALAVCFAASLPEYGFLRRTSVLVASFAAVMGLLLLVYLFGAVVNGAQNRFNLGFFALQPSDPAKLLLVLVLAKYFARRHIAIQHLRHILVSGGYAFALFALVFFQPDLGSAIIIASIWLGMVLVAGISWRHLALLITIALIAAGAMWHWGLQPYQKQRVLTFLHPLTDIQGAGYNAYQSTVAVGSGELTGKGIGYGTQSKLQFLPEYQTDFIFAAYAEEWGFFGVLLLFGLYGIIIVRILGFALHAGDNFDMLFGAGLAVYLIAQFLVHVGMNIGLLPITGTTLPFMSYGGSHLMTEYASLGILMSMRRHARPVVRDTSRDDLTSVL